MRKWGVSLLAGALVVGVAMLPGKAAAFSIFASITAAAVPPGDNIDSSAADASVISFFATLDADDIMTVAEVHVFLAGSSVVNLNAAAAPTTTTDPRGWRDANQSVTGSSQAGFDAEITMGALTIPNEVVMSGSFLNTITITRQAWDSTDSPVPLGSIILLSKAGGESGAVTLSLFNDGDVFNVDPDESRLSNVEGLQHTAPGGELFCITVGGGSCGGAEIPEPATYVLVGLGLAGLAALRRRDGGTQG